MMSRESLEGAEPAKARMMGYLNKDPTFIFGSTDGVYSNSVVNLVGVSVQAGLHCLVNLYENCRRCSGVSPEDWDAMLQAELKKLRENEMGSQN